MGRRLDVEQLVGTAEIAERVGVGGSVVGDWRRRYPEFPAPVARLAMGALWHWPEVERWA